MLYDGSINVRQLETERVSKLVWLIREEDKQEELAQQFINLINSDSILKMPGTHDGLSAAIAKQVGFRALYLSGAAYSASRGWPDLGLITSEEMAQRARDIIRATGLPLLVDIDTGYGGVLNVARAAREMVEAKVAAVQIEDQMMPKKCGHLSGKQLIPKEEMMEKIKMIKEVAPTLVVIARTDARGVTGMEEAIDRAKDYIKAGADAIFPEALQHEDEFKRFSREVKAPLLANMTEFGKTPYYTADQFQAWGYKMVIYPVSALRMAAKAYEKVFQAIWESGSQQSCLAEMQTRKELYETIGYHTYEELDQKINKSILP